jgi:hypothetical protein
VPKPKDNDDQVFSSIFKYFLKSPKKRIIRVCLNQIESMSLLWLTMMYNINPYVEVFKMARDMMATEGAPTDLKLRLIAFRTKDVHRYNVLIADEITALMVGDGSEAIDRRDVVVAQQAGPFQRISELHV